MSNFLKIFSITLFVSGFIFWGLPSEAADIFVDCTAHSDCNSGSCVSNACFCSPTLIPPGAPSKCILKYSTGSDCTDSYECISGNCSGGTCTSGGASLGEACGRNEDCNMGGCVGGFCICGTSGVCEMGVTPTGPVEFNSPIGQISPSRFIGNAIKTVLGIIGAVALAIFVYGGFVWMTSGGSPEKIKNAQTTIVWAVLGMIVIFVSYAAVDFVLRALGVYE